jgi:7-cyano-7-deazaguanine synthase
MTKKIVIVLSGGMDSGVLLAQLSTEEQEIHAISFNYRSKHNTIEIQYAKKLCLKYRVKKHIIINLDFIKKYFNSSLLQRKTSIPEGHYAAENMKSTIVPFRNGIMLSIAAGYADNIEAKEIYVGAHAGDHFIYPDCRLPFLGYMRETIYHGTTNNVILYYPFGHSTKRDIAIAGKQINFNFSKTYSCYKGGKNHCGVSGTCVERKEALEGFDLTRYEK